MRKKCETAHYFTVLPCAQKAGLKTKWLIIAGYNSKTKEATCYTE